MTRTAWFAGPLLLAVLLLLGMRLKLVTLNNAVRGVLLPAGVGIVIGLVVGNFLMPTLRWERTDPWSLTYSQVEQAVPYLIKGMTPPKQGATASTSADNNQQSGPATIPGQPVPGGPKGQNHAVPTPDPNVKSGSTFVDKLQQLISPGDSPSVQGRLSIFSNTIDGWLKRPIFGWGTGSYPFIYPPDYTGAYWIANLELHILFDTGLAGIVLFAIPVVITARRAARVLRTPAADWDTMHFIVLGMLVAGAGLLFAYQVTDATWMGFTWVFFALLVMAGRVTAPPDRLRAQTPVPASARADARE